MATYKEKLLDPRWQKKRLEILERDEWGCRLCHDKTETLHVHHTGYLPKTSPWEYPDIMLITLCRSCHIREHTWVCDGLKELEITLRSIGYTSHTIHDLVNVINDAGFTHTTLNALLVEYLYKSTDNG